MGRCHTTVALPCGSTAARGIEALAPVGFDRVVVFPKLSLYVATGAAWVTMTAPLDLDQVRTPVPDSLTARCGLVALWPGGVRSTGADHEPNARCELWITAFDPLNRCQTTMPWSRLSNAATGKDASCPGSERSFGAVHVPGAKNRATSAMWLRPLFRRHATRPWPLELKPIDTCDASPPDADTFTGAPHDGEPFTCHAAWTIESAPSIRVQTAIALPDPSTLTCGESVASCPGAKRSAGAPQVSVAGSNLLACTTVFMPSWRCHTATTSPKLLLARSTVLALPPGAERSSAGPQNLLVASQRAAWMMVCEPLKRCHAANTFPSRICGDGRVSRGVAGDGQVARIAPHSGGSGRLRGLGDGGEDGSGRQGGAEGCHGDRGTRRAVAMLSHAGEGTDRSRRPPEQCLPTAAGRCTYAPPAGQRRATSLLACWP